MALEMVVGFVEEALDGCVLDCALHAFDLAIGSRMLGRGEAMVDIAGRPQRRAVDVGIAPCRRVGV
jgi:hypothetical protein